MNGTPVNARSEGSAGEPGRAVGTARDEGAPRRRGGKPAAGSPVIDRAFALLNAFDSGHRALTPAELAQRAGMPRSSALRLARSLVRVGALERRADGVFVVGLRLLETASLAPRGHGLRAVAMPYLDDLVHVTHQHALLAVRDEAEALLVERLSAREASPVRYRVGGRVPLTHTGVGLVLLAFAPPTLQDRLIASYVPGPGLDDVRTPADLRRLLAEVRRTGFARGRLTTPWPMSTVAAPVRDASGVVAALSVVAPSDSFPATDYAAAVRATARAVSRALRADAEEAPAAG
ncbi:transcriptional regulator, IclR family [Streptomyces sp. LcepLS]|nr:IclR family transcriptional regulator [Streptomyces sp. SID4945]MYR25341.1 helix-turn-helix domain-containing protein [Streptomyces sp. SID4945]SCD39779.1 transcriptional regulator, IclR family [Streptomyces sp. TverLS-915]SCE78903.1 transcriptional regulator, IclR family [Streptomyces sp. LcepLS]